MFPSEPSDGSLGVWSECSESNTSGDRRGLGSSGPYSLSPGGSIQLSVAYTTHWDINYPCPAWPNIVSPADTPLIFASFQNLGQCTGLEVDFSTNIAGKADSLFWDFGDPTSSNNTSTSISSSHTYNTSGTYEITLLIYNTNCTADTVRDTITITDKLPVDLGNDSSACDLDSLILDAGTFPQAIYNWSTNESTSTIVIKKSGVYIVDVDFNDCKGSDTINLVIGDCDLFVPNAFSPNGDGINDELKVSGKGIDTYSFKVFNLLGKVVFESNNISIDWDGKNLDGKIEPTGNYVYAVTATLLAGETINYHGNILLVR